MLTSMLWITLSVAVAGDNGKCKDAQIRDRLDVWQKYVSRYPAGRCADVAKLRIEMLQADDQECRKARSSRDEVLAWQEYLRRYPTGTCAMEGVTRLKLAGAAVLPMQEDEAAEGPPAITKPKGPVARATVEGVDLSGPGAEAIPAALNALTLPLIGCYVDHLDLGPGAVTLSLTVGADGSASGVKVQESDFEDEGIGTCLTGAVGRATFDAQDGPTKGGIRIDLEPVD